MADGGRSKNKKKNTDPSWVLGGGAPWSLEGGFRGTGAERTPVQFSKNLPGKGGKREFFVHFSALFTLDLGDTPRGAVRGSRWGGAIGVTTTEAGGTYSFSGGRQGRSGKSGYRGGPGPPGRATLGGGAQFLLRRSSQ